jgi:hypothetical protein
LNEQDYYKANMNVSSTIEAYLDELRIPNQRPRQSFLSTSAALPSAATKIATPVAAVVSTRSVVKDTREVISSGLNNAMILYRINHFDWLIRRAKKARNLEFLEKFVSSRKEFMASNATPAEASVPDEFRSIPSTEVRAQLEWLIGQVSSRAEQLWDTDGSEDADVLLIREVEDIKASLQQDLQELDDVKVDS